MIDGVTDVLLLAVVAELAGLQILLIARWTGYLSMWLCWALTWLAGVGMVAAVVVG